MIPDTALGDASLSDPLTIAAPLFVFVIGHVLFYERVLF